MTKMTPDFHLAIIVNRIFVTSKIVRSREDGIARFASGRVESLALVRTSLRIALCDALRMCRRVLSVTLTLVPLQFQW